MTKLFMLISIVFFIPLFSNAEIIGCKADLNGDKMEDLVVADMGQSSVEVIVLVKINSSYRPHVLTKQSGRAQVTCEKGSFIIESRAGKDNHKPKEHSTGGSYVRVKQPEGASAAYIWKDNKFREVWVED